MGGVNDEWAWGLMYYSVWLIIIVVWLVVSVIHSACSLSSNQVMRLVM